MATGKWRHRHQCVHAPKIQKTAARLTIHSGSCPIFLVVRRHPCPNPPQSPHRANHSHQPSSSSSHHPTSRSIHLDPWIEIQRPGGAPCNSRKPLLPWFRSTPELVLEHDAALADPRRPGTPPPPFELSHRISLSAAGNELPTPGSAPPSPRQVLELHVATRELSPRQVHRRLPPLLPLLHGTGDAALISESSRRPRPPSTTCNSSSNPSLQVPTIPVRMTQPSSSGSTMRNVVVTMFRFLMIRHIVIPSKF
nr:formin-like protein 3 [Aegilops tauschii subsp. strangulata]